MTAARSVAGKRASAAFQHRIHHCRCSFINSLYDNFGSDHGAGKGGQGFVVDPDHPNGVAPGKRPLHTLIPGLVTKDGKVTLSYGVGGD